MKKAWCIFFSFIFLQSCCLGCLAASEAEVRIVRENEDGVFALSQEAVPVAKSSTNETAADGALPVEIKAKSAILMEVTTGQVLLESRADEKLFPASVTKIMTILLVLEAIQEGKISLADKVTCSENATSKGGSQIWLEVGETMTVDELLRATVIGSANDAATLLGEYVSGSETAFVSRMNERAKELGMKNTNFENATGLDDTTDTHLTTARDIALMSSELLKHDLIRNYSTVWMDTLRDGKTELVNTNKLVRFFKGTTGLKTGTTSKAGCCVSASAQREKLHLVAVVMGSDNSADRFETAKALLNWGFANYTMFTPTVDASLLTEVLVKNGEARAVQPVMPKAAPLPVKKGEEAAITAKVDLAADVEAPVVDSQKLGTVTFSLGDKVVASYGLFAEKPVEKLTMKTVLIWMLRFLARGEKPA